MSIYFAAITVSDTVNILTSKMENALNKGQLLMLLEDAKKLKSLADAQACTEIEDNVWDDIWVKIRQHYPDFSADYVIDTRRVCQLYQLAYAYRCFPPEVSDILKYASEVGVGILQLPMGDE